MKKNKIIVEHGTDHETDGMIYRKRKKITNIANKRIEVTIVGSRDRLIHTDIPENDPNHITYSDWEIIKTTQKESLIK